MKFWPGESIIILYGHYYNNNNEKIPSSRRLPLWSSGDDEREVESSILGECKRFSLMRSVVCGCGKRVQVQIVGGEVNVEGEGGAK